MEPKNKSNSSKLRALITSSETEFIMEAHNGLSAKIVKEAGFKGIWASGLAISAQHGVRDNNELSWTQVVDTLEFMSDATDLPILVDGDTGYGDFNNMRRLVRKLEQRSIAGVCIEDKLFPKTNSFIASELQPLAEIDEFCGKIKAGKDSQLDTNFSIVARVEALIAGWGMSEALKRAEAYRQAGADAILIHSKISKADEVLAFANEWAGRCPLVIVPTKYYSTPTDVYRGAGINLVIWANHLLRSCITAMQKTAATIMENEGLVQVEEQIASVAEIFRLQGADELLAAEAKYTATGSSSAKAIVLGATRGEELNELTENCPKVMLPVGNKPLLRRLVDSFKSNGINEVTVVGGYRAETIDVPGVEVVYNSNYAAGGELTSLACVINSLESDSVVLYGDLLFRNYILSDLLSYEQPLVVVVDAAIVTENYSANSDFAYCSARDQAALYRQDVQLEQVSTEGSWQGKSSCGNWIGMLRISAQGKQWVEEAFAELKKKSTFSGLGMPDLLNKIIELGHPVAVMYINGHWLDVNNLADLQRANAFIQD